MIYLCYVSEILFHFHYTKHLSNSTYVQLFQVSIIFGPPCVGIHSGNLRGAVGHVSIHLVHASGTHVASFSQVEDGIFDLVDSMFLAQGTPHQRWEEKEEK